MNKKTEEMPKNIIFKRFSRPCTNCKLYQLYNQVSGSVFISHFQAWSLPWKPIVNQSYENSPKICFYLPGQWILGYSYCCCITNQHKANGFNMPCLIVRHTVMTLQVYLHNTAWLYVTLNGCSNKQCLLSFIVDHLIAKTRWSLFIDLIGPLVYATDEVS